MEKLKEEGCSWADHTEKAEAIGFTALNLML